MGQYFRYGIASALAHAGVTPGELEAQLNKQGETSMLANLADAVAYLTLAVPPLAGAAVGYGASRMLTPDASSKLDEMRKAQVLADLERNSRELRRKLNIKETDADASTSAQGAESSDPGRAIVAS